ncbi:hypothetical protein ACOSP7_022128 [Xanthoceras sorbifolium]|uniref:LysM domain-containing protein n=1 Tax=Xanthoceras sorbifolium TaxID=99658 RepID=A0ABQ8HNQ2_9ROSI|nr:hypothetical protein JRO89_XS08G0049700 [Xanthoceras sorbifolium]
MAMANNKTSKLFNLFFLLSIFLIISVAQSRILVAESSPQCETVVGVVSGDTCSAIAQKSGLTTELFGSINPNLNCDDLFVGQWLCVSGTA